MINMLLTAMLLTMPLLLLQDNLYRNGLNTGLWVSLFFWGRIYAGLSVVVFGVALFYSLFTRKDSGSAVTGEPDIHVKRTSMPQFYIFLSAMVIFCALGKVAPAYGEFLRLDQSLLDTAASAGFLGSLAGPIFFGHLSDKKGPFPAMITLILLAALSIAITAYSAVSPALFPAGQGSLWLTISGTFVLLPIFMQLYFGRSHLIRTAPPLIALMTALWAFVYYVFETDEQQIFHSTTFLTFAVYLILVAALFSFLAWKNRLVLVK